MLRLVLPRFLSLAPVALALALAASALAAPSVRLQPRLRSRDAYLGETFALVAEIQDPPADSPRIAFECAAGAATVEFADEGVSSMSSIQIINGKRTVEEYRTLTQTYLVTPTAAGPLVLRFTPTKELRSASPREIRINVLGPVDPAVLALVSELSSDPEIEHFTFLGAYGEK